MKFYAFKGNHELGAEPCGTEGRILFELKTFWGARRKARALLGPVYKLFTYSNFYDDKTFRQH
jgi:hypothetical protein